MFCVCGLEITAMRELVLPNLSIAMIYICEDFCLLLLYGIVSPYCAFAIGLGLLGRIFMTRGGILRYYKLLTSELADKALESEHEPKDEEKQKAIADGPGALEGPPQGAHCNLASIQGVFQGHQEGQEHL